MKTILYVVFIWASTFLFTETTTLKSYSKQYYPTKELQNKFKKYDSLFAQHPEFVAKSFDFPVGKPNAKGYYNAQKFQVNQHLGDDWNGVGGGNSDLGDPIYSIANGYVSFADDIGGGWGNVIRIIHKYKGKYYESVYAHCDAIKVRIGDFVTKGKLIGTIGNADGIYLAHLHFEIRDDIFMDIGPGYSNNTKGYLDPTKFINEH
ncbi:M23 family metallopeptidase [Aquimarina litoralis]|uniref:M23 family metallopeptidase n=1 Tax=Aquimarina litoralis TaxID=584605 RepID=UPI001C59B205|nr:M23 family metallopeptidase [Aquimarina litoralis]MBW1297528.1 peptidoglycan DD-metalloendopeptidase family protein [Aquimarina litoralis]